MGLHEGPVYSFPALPVRTLGQSPALPGHSECIARKGQLGEDLGLVLGASRPSGFP